jgi:hypothetical protein
MLQRYIRLVVAHPTNLFLTSLMRYVDYTQHSRSEYKETAIWIRQIGRRDARLDVSQSAWRGEKELKNDKDCVWYKYLRL